MYSLTAWDGVGAEIVGAAVAGVFGGLTVLLGVHLARKEDQKKFQRAMQAQADQERLQAANTLMMTVHTLRDELAVSRDGIDGDVRMYPLRERLLLTERVLGDYPSFAAVQEFYDAANAYRTWARDHGERSRDEATVVAVQQFREAFARYGDRVINLLKDGYDDRGATIDGRATLPVLPL